MTQRLLNPLQQKNQIKYLVLSDIHLGHKRTTSKEIIKNLIDFFGDFKQGTALEDIDILFIAGDLFDQALWFDSDDVIHILLFIRRLMGWCEQHGIKLRILEGTPSHDRSQARNLTPLALTFPNLDYRYIETLCIEAFFDLGITCLYIPDEFGGSAEGAQKLVQQELDKVGLEKVDIAILHGMFKYQVPEIASDRFKYDEDFFLQRVNHFINIGHVHIPSTYLRILCQGSFDRLCQNEEHPKGGMLMIIDKLEGNSYYFIENKGAKIYKTVHIKTKDFDKAVAQIRKVADSLPDGSYIRIKAHKGHPVLNVVNQISKEYLMLIFNTITEEDEKERQQLLDATEVLSIDYTPININKENIIPMLLNEVKTKYDFPPLLIERLNERLKDIL